MFIIFCHSTLFARIANFYVAKYHVGKVKLEQMQPTVFPIGQYVTCGVASRGFAGFQGSLSFPSNGVLLYSAQTNYLRFMALHMECYQLIFADQKHGYV